MLATSETERQQREAANSQTPLGKLPGELRNRIWYLVLPTGGVVNTRSDDRFTSSESVDCEIEMEYHDCSNPNITEVCRSIREETLGIYYGSNTFVLHLDRAQDCRTCTVDDDESCTLIVAEAKYWIRSRSNPAIEALRTLYLMLPPWEPDPDENGHPREHDGYCRTLVRVDWVSQKSKLWPICNACTVCRVDLDLKLLGVPGTVEVCTGIAASFPGTKAAKLVKLVTEVKEALRDDLQ
ncbi:hypothetical protein CLAFUW4_08462 [Fulvia fulva]|uniref:2EXR domain-containing protein n=1 Tax=Passalora fulva TaxID=5499 RepID=A0A9Q8P653_PASFU|nr:uncharacterized protein CLAFUR5_08566 [Fulvia fulva]KAK4629293.1 hypothetical protein CLAFUR4_08467 [Fulvia fulva]KAK4630428.1 hypothetical protein CLAFUR0_08462 [Fulvia fulva]UJO14790.1 hypothetical protein CLAFUR5_08566 [Fulvia fulva]WPV12575.1 hypothetical protein CLAFUW4_08462 [Fulvia fulva]WPV27248.1 hypothetical protein CLAFUW7_08462 [Fulvia fulva]